MQLLGREKGSVPDTCCIWGAMAAAPQPFGISACNRLPMQEQERHAFQLQHGEGPLERSALEDGPAAACLRTAACACGDALVLEPHGAAP